MGRRIPIPSLVSRIRAIRAMKGLSQQELARQVDLTRQAMGAIESGQYIPNTAVALRLAQVLGCRVEDLFVWADSAPLPTVDLVTASQSDARRLAVVNVRGRWIGYPLIASQQFQEGFISADGLRDSDTPPGQAHLLLPPDDLQGSALLLGCDPSLGILSSHLARWRSEGRLLWLSTASQPALDAVANSQAHLAGSHLRDWPTGEYNVPQARRALNSTGGLVVAFARWEQGFVVAPGNPKRIRAVADLARPDVRTINREIGAGSRALLDDLLAQAAVPPEVVSGYGRAVSTHLAVARAVADGVADVGIGLEAVARAYDLDFLPLATVHFDLIIPRDQLAHPVVAILLEHLQSRSLRADLRALPGYDVDLLGTVIADIPLAVA